VLFAAGRLRVSRKRRWVPRLRRAALYTDGMRLLGCGAGAAKHAGVASGADHEYLLCQRAS